MMSPFAFIQNGFEKTKEKVSAWDQRINRSTFGRVFRLEGSGHPKSIRGATFFREVRAGLTTFATMAYIIAVNSAILSDSGGTCECPIGSEPGCPGDAAMTMCQTTLKRDLITATSALAGLASILFGFLTNLPVALGPGMGLNAYFTYQVVGWRGSGHIPYRIALTAIFVEGFIFMFLALTGMRQWLVRMIPATIKTACGVGIGLFLTEIGLSYSAGIGAITGGFTTPLAIGGCPPEMLDSSAECSGGIMTNPAIVAFHPIETTLAVQQWNLEGASGAQFALALVTFLYVDIIDCTATLYSMAKFCGVVEEDGDFPRSTVAYCTDAACISIGSLFGCSPVTAFIESGAGIAEGGRTGLTAISTGFCFLISLFFAPILASIPPWATGATLILVGCLMIRQVTNINWQYIGDAVPSFVTLAFMPFSYSVAYGLIAGMLVYIVLNTMIWAVVQFTSGRVTPANWQSKEVYSFGLGKRDMPAWVRFVRRRFFPDHATEGIRKDGIELADCDSTINHGSRSASAEGKQIQVLRPHHMDYDLPSLD
ncbi:hypothetical protein FHL15_006114 [Xylaria flabelliformis]|uniref:Xanthine/uracil permease n=1 Tax=Xylaria flabelliformis TaxID=2512241 RepID=A0A553HYE9_9PEZI|nr:hypothetical protein FHL15_006114 [Xylaria flabelliformis]